METIIHLYEQSWFQFILFILSFAMWIWYACMEGIREGRYYYLRNAPELINVRNGIRWIRTHNEHGLFTFQRGMVYLFLEIIKFSIFFFSFSTYKSWEIYFMIPIMLLLPISIFPFFHDGCYYSEYNRLSKVDYEKKWFAESTTSTAVIELTKNERITLFVFSILLLIVEMLILFVF